MEVFIQGVPPLETEKSLYNFFAGLLGCPIIDDWMRQKISRKVFANPFLLKAEEGEQFLDLHGRIKIADGRNFLSPSKTNLTLNGQSLSCSRSKEMDIIAIRRT